MHHADRPSALTAQSMLPFLASEYVPAAINRAGFHIIPVPFEASVSYGTGTARGPQALLAASQQLEATEMGLAPGEAGFYTSPAIDCTGSTETVLGRIEEAVTGAATVGAVPVLLGGEHTVTLGALRALAGLDEPFGIVQVDAHADLRPEYNGNPLSHASVMYRAVADLGLPLAQFACREFCREEQAIRRRYRVITHDAEELADNGLPAEPLPEDFPRAIYLTFDVDGLDAPLMPATGTPSPGGLSWHETRRLLRRVVGGRRVIGLDVVELAPQPGLIHADFTAAKLAHLLMALAYAGNRGNGKE